MTTEFEPFPHPDPFDIPAGQAFAGWPAQILFEIQELLFDRSSDWLNAVASQIDALVTTENADKIFEDVDGPRESLAHSESWQFSEYVQPGRIGVFAALEPRVHWDQLSPPTERWQRYAVFALMYLRDSVTILARLDKLKPAGRPMNADNKYLSFDYEEAGAWALEAMRALQIAHSLRIEHRNLSRRGKHAADELHKYGNSKRDEAISMADLGRPPHGTPFLTQEAAAEYISQSLMKKNGRDFYKFETVKKWLIKAKWKAPRSR